MSPQKTQSDVNARFVPPRRLTLCLCSSSTVRSWARALDSLTVAEAMFVIDKTVVVLLPVKIFLDVIRWINDTDYTAFSSVFTVL